MNSREATASRVPPERKSDESKQEQLTLARKQGDAYKAALDNMTKKEAHGAEQRAGDYFVGYAVEHAEGMYMFSDGKLEWHNPTDENAHIEIAVRDGGDGRFVPGLAVTLTVLDSSGREIGVHEQPFLWHPWLYHYGRNWTLPGDGKYSFRVHIEPPRYMRHDKTNGKRYAEPVDVTFDAVEIETGQKIS